jgi:hypothetical protein
VGLLRGLLRRAAAAVAGAVARRSDAVASASAPSRCAFARRTAGSVLPTSRTRRQPTPRIATNARAATIRLAPLLTVPPVAAPSCVSWVRRLSGTACWSWVSLTHCAAPFAAAFAILTASAAVGPWPKTVTTGCSGSARKVIR